MENARSANADLRPIAQRRIRSQDRADQWRRHVEQRTGQWLAQAKTETERAAIEAAYHEEIERGPDFARVRRNALRGAGDQPTGLDRNSLARLIVQFEAIVRGTWKHARNDARAKNKRIRPEFARSVLPVLRALVRLTTKYSGRSVFPSLEGLAHLAQCSRRTVCRAIAQLERWGFVVITRRSKLVATPYGLWLTQDTSIYRLQQPTGLSAMALRAFGIFSECQDGLARVSTDRGNRVKNRVAETIQAQRMPRRADMSENDAYLQRRSAQLASMWAARR